MGHPVRRSRALFCFFAFFAAVVDSNGLPVRLALTAGEAHDNRLAAKLLSGALLLADRGYDDDGIVTTRSASVRICTARATWSSGPSTRSSSVDVGLGRTLVKDLKAAGLPAVGVFPEGDKLDTRLHPARKVRKSASVLARTSALAR
jgi:hypothetical protein